MPTLPQALKSKYPQVVLIGRTNAGKSTLFNRLTDSGHAIISAIANTTRDQNRALVHWKGFSFELIDTGGLDMSSYDPLDQEIRKQVELGTREAAAVVFVLDGLGDVMPQDVEGARFLQQQKRPVIACINKADSLRQRTVGMGTFASMPFETMIACSAKNGTGTAELLDAIFEVIPKVATEIDHSKPINVAIIGQPNVGKSTLFNSLIGEQRVIVSPIPHTTRDPHDTMVTYNDQLFNLIDTAGMRRKTRVGTGDDGSLEKMSVRGTKVSIERADVVIFVIEAQKRIAHQDKALMDYIKMKGKSFILAVNKWDLIPDKSPSTINEYTKYYSHHYDYSPETPIIFISALEHQRTRELLEIANDVYTAAGYQMPQEDLDTVIRKILSSEPKERRSGFAVKPKKKLVLEKLLQTNVRPPQFVLVTPRPRNVAPAVIHKIEKAIRQAYPFDGVPIYLEVTQKAPEGRKSTK